MRMSAHKKFVLELRAPVERYETRSAAGCKPGTAREDDLGQMLEKNSTSFLARGRRTEKGKKGMWSNAGSFDDDAGGIPVQCFLEIRGGLYMVPQPAVPPAGGA